MDYGVQLGRRFRSLKLWTVMRAFGAEGLAERVRFHVALAQELAAWVRDEPGWEIMAPHPLSLVCFRCAPPALSPEAQDALNERIMHAVHSTGEAFLSHTKLRGRYVLRLAIGNIRTELSHVARACELLREAAASTESPAEDAVAARAEIDHGDAARSHPARSLTVRPSWTSMLPTTRPVAVSCARWPPSPSSSPGLSC